ncbi:MAG: biotin--[acetyl-CoA-carboxylase] ligase [Coriobacteriales bacterium]|jgi:biotin-[acetyl-CoA-carboxylase] ligase BirA-like protein
MVRVRDLDAGGERLLRIYDQTTSTNDVAKRLAAAGAPNGLAVAAHRQTQGRGRRGHRWSSARETMCISVVLRPDVPMPFFVALPAVATLSVLGALRDLTGLGTRLGVKWPNDLVAFGAGERPGASDGRKLGGMLVEAGHDGSGAYAVAGQGVNMWSASTPAGGRPDPTAPAGQVEPAASVRPLEPASLEDLLGADAVPPFDDLAEALRERVTLTVGEWAARLRAQGASLTSPLDPILGELYDAMPALGHRVVALSPQGETVASGILAGVDGWGRAVLATQEGERHLASEQVSLRVQG